MCKVRRLECSSKKAASKVVPQEKWKIRSKRILVGNTTVAMYDGSLTSPSQMTFWNSTMTYHQKAKKTDDEWGSCFMLHVFVFFLIKTLPFYTVAIT